MYHQKLNEPKGFKAETFLSFLILKLLAKRADMCTPIKHLRKLRFFWGFSHAVWSEASSMVWQIGCIYIIYYIYYNNLENRLRVTLNNTYIYIYYIIYYILFSVILKQFSRLLYMRYCFNQSCNCCKLTEKMNFRNNC